MIALFKKYFTKSVFLLLPQAIAVPVGLITLPIVLNSLPIKDYGQYQFVLAIFAWLMALTGSHITRGARRAIAIDNQNEFLYGIFFRLKIAACVNLIGLLISGILYFYFKLNLLAALLTIAFIFYLGGAITNTSFTSYMVAKKRFSQKAKWDILSQLLITVTSTAVAYVTKNIIWFAIAQFGITALASLVGLIYLIYKDGLLQKYQTQDISKESIAYGLNLMPAHIISLTASKISSFIIGPFLGSANLAIFSVANNLNNNLTSIIKAANPLLYSDFATQNKNELIKVIENKLRLLVTISLIFTLFAVSFSYFYIKIFLPEIYHPAILYLFIIALALPATSLSLIFQTFMESHLLSKKINQSVITIDLIKIGLILAFGYLWSITGICVAIAVSGWIGFIINYKLVFKTD